MLFESLSEMARWRREESTTRIGIDRLQEIHDYHTEGGCREKQIYMDLRQEVASKES
jgi:hypothetical protein